MTVDAIVLTPEDWPLWRRLRQAALTEAPDAFGSTVAQWTGSGDTEERWRRRLQDVELNLALTVDGEPVGIVSATAPNASGEVELISLWIGPLARGRGVGDEAVRRVLAWAAETYPGAPVVLSVKRSNAQARRLYERHGFVDAGPSPDDPDEDRMLNPEPDRRP
jgi:ribosomal protein S18 acetylase RimI-like enzyme